ncbi:lipoprotein insertase outer membrane protein LolB [Arenicella xantha]|uniref:Outer-membrane lipoprotein LolB n=1 Tax=Arenicella xantha TaxID=644221 RepID=A0A395JT80_9GAMM|nr:lipoprotein insertase outer membrane protein LolB [Arenicella xantha]RBP52768.1 outer membrane lipoprotein LolB [Arenicella xantha]
MWMRYCWLIGLVLTVSACTSVPKPDMDGVGREWLSDASRFAEPTRLFLELNNWQYQAKVGVKTPRANEQANLIWRYGDESHEVRLFGPLGAGAVKIQFDQFGVVLSDNKGNVHRGNSAEKLLTEIVGWPIPIEALTYWLFAIPNPQHSYRYQVDESGQVALLQQLGWSIQWSSYQPYHAEHSLPRKLIATKSLRNGKQVVVRLVTKGWKWSQ